LVQDERPGLSDRLFHRQDAHKVIADAEVIAFGFDIRVDDLIVEKLRALWPSRDAPPVVVEQPAKESELAVPVEHFNLHKVGELTIEGLNFLV
jgi:hypothetical protein